MKKGKLGAILLALVLIIGLVCCVVCLEKIPAGYVGVVYNMNGGVDGEAWNRAGIWLLDQKVTSILSVLSSHI